MHKCGKCCHQCASGALESTRAGTEDLVFTGVVLGSAILTFSMNFANMSCIRMAQKYSREEVFRICYAIGWHKKFPRNLMCHLFAGWYKVPPPPPRWFSLLAFSNKQKTKKGRTGSGFQFRFGFWATLLLSGKN